MAQENQNVNVVSTKVWTIIDYKLFKKQLNMKFRINQLWGSIFLMSMLCVSCISPKEEPIPNYHVLTGDVANYQYDAISAMTYADRPITPMDMGLKGDVVNVEYTSRQGTIYSYSFDPNTSYLQKIEQITPIYTGSMLNATTYFLYDENNKPAMARTYWDGRLLRSIEFVRDENDKQLQVETDYTVKNLLPPDTYEIIDGKTLRYTDDVRDPSNKGFSLYLFSQMKDTVALAWTGDILNPNIMNGLIDFVQYGSIHDGLITKGEGQLSHHMRSQLIVDYQTQIEYDDQARATYFKIEFTSKNRSQLFREDSIVVRYKYEDEDEQGNWTSCDADIYNHPFCPITRKITYAKDWKEDENPLLKNGVVVLYESIQRRKAVVDYFSLQGKAYILYSGWADNDQYYTYVIPAGEIDPDLEYTFKRTEFGYGYERALSKLKVNGQRASFYALNLRDRCQDAPIILVAQDISHISPVNSAKLVDENAEGCDLQIEFLSGKNSNIHIPVMN